MAKRMRNLNAWIEVAPAPVIYPRKISNSPSLETILEESSRDLAIGKGRNFNGSDNGGFCPIQFRGSSSLNIVQ
ncbi:hypothetical protein D8674_008373 [Pyrus ussuriensis x Pyrus communis]|uniref:Uncharacterized protein n=1 Tax=Pyrus ussuriensis x Pyrus communis TaxID=2448454 RepID=A0A5N5I5G2_9ROSA|nr:hypothetical protein D8674_008373 [Pyrus ussuriensis x Pyrus communis]